MKVANVQWPDTPLGDAVDLRQLIDRGFAEALLSRVAAARAAAGDLPEAFSSLRTQNPHDAPGAFDVSSMFRAFSAVRPRPGWALDYVYQGNQHEGSPLLYARATDEKPLPGVEAFEAHFHVKVAGFAPDFPELYLPALEFDAGPKAAFEAAVFLHEARKFYFFWHALYDYRTISLGGDPARDLSWGADRAAGVRALAAAATPAVLPLGLRAWAVEFLTWSDCKGYEVRTMTVESPRRLVDVKTRTIAPPATRLLY